MLLKSPYYYKEFHCIADKCKDSCCIGWEIDIDEDTLTYYRTLEGEFGDRLRREICKGEENSFHLYGGRCAFLNEDNLCDICIQLGEEALCDVCTEYPRCTIDYGSTREKCLALSCEEAARLHFSRTEPLIFVESVLTGEAEGDSFGDWLSGIRDYMITILQKRTMSVTERIVKTLEFAELAQESINRNEQTDISVLISKLDNTSEKQEHSETSPYEQFKERMEVLSHLEVIDREWRKTQKELNTFFAGEDGNEKQYFYYHRAFGEYYKKKEYEYEHLAVYFIFRYCMKAIYDYDLLAKVKLMAVSVLVILDLDVCRFFQNGKEFTLEDRIATVKSYSKEVEHSEDNLSYLKESFMFEDVFSTKELRENLFRLTF